MYPSNPRLTAPTGAAGYRYENLAGDAHNGEDTFVVVTLSGGGTRAAAFGYGVLHEMARQPVGDGRTMLDETDVVSSVSGGSFAAAYLGLFGQRKFLADFPKDVLHRKLEYGIVGHLLLPWNWFRLMSPWLSRSDIASEYYDDAIFHGKTFADMGKTADGARHRPFVVLNATDIVEGAQFSFTQNHFERLCSNLDGVHVARGVTASSAFPVAFPPLTLNDYPKSACHYQQPGWVTSKLQDPIDAAETNPAAYTLARTWASYERQDKAYVHLSDGGLADNIGLRSPYNAFTTADDWGMLQRLNGGAIRNLIVIVVDAKPKSPSCLDRSSHAPGWATVLEAAATTPMENYSADTVELMQKLTDDWTKEQMRFEFRRKQCAKVCGPHRHGPGCDDACRQTLQVPSPLRPTVPSVYLAHVRFDALAASADKKRLETIPTSLQLSDEDVALLVRWGAELLRESQGYRDAVTALGGTLVPPER
jgi:NTE family protein